jgi:phospholipid/cholesterol/gamma-HCH transport system ATP-binding protein
MIHKGELVGLGTTDEIKSSQNPYIQQFIHGRPEGPIDFFKEDIGMIEALGL